MLAVAVATAVIGVVQTWLSTAVGQRVMHRLRSDLFAHLQRQSLASSPARAAVRCSRA